MGESEINWPLLEQLRGREHPLLHIGVFEPPLPMGVGEVLLEARTAHHLLDMLGIPHAELSYASDLDARTWQAVMAALASQEWLARISDWHSRETGPAGSVGDFCVECGKRWPCDSRRMADGVYADEDAPPAGLEV